MLMETVCQHFLKTSHQLLSINAGLREHLHSNTSAKANSKHSNYVPLCLVLAYIKKLNEEVSLA
jgi:hypothetical protein